MDCYSLQTLRLQQKYFEIDDKTGLHVLYPADYLIVMDRTQYKSRQLTVDKVQGTRQHLSPSQDETCSARAEIHLHHYSDLHQRKPGSFRKTYQKVLLPVILNLNSKMISVVATDIIVQIIDQIIDNISKTVNENKNITH